MHHTPTPEKVELSEAELDALKIRLTESSLSDADTQLVIKCLHFMGWLQTGLSPALTHQATLSHR